MAVLAMHRHEHKADYSHIYWFFVAVAYKVPWTAISSLLGQFSYQFKQPRILLYLNLAYFVPSVPALLIHSSIRERLERRYGVPKAALIRFTVGLGGLCLLCLMMPLFSSSPHLLLSATAAVGVLYSIAFGTSYELVTHFPPACTVALTTGFVSCGIVVLIADLFFKQGPYYRPSGLARLFQIVALQTAVGLFAAATVIRRHWRRLAAAAAGDLTAAAAAAVDGGAGRSTSGRMIIGVPCQNSSSSNSSRLMMMRSASPIWPSSSSSSSSSLYSQQQQQQQQQQGVMAAAGASSGHHYTADGLRHRADVEQQQQQQQSPMPGTQNSAAAGSVAINFNSVYPVVSDQPSSLSPKKQWNKSLKPSHSASLISRCHNSVITPLFHLLQVGAVIWPACLGLMMSVGSSMMVFPFFTFVPHTGYFGEHIPQVLFYSRLLGDIAGRLMPQRFHLSSSKAVLAAAATKTKLLMLLIPALLNPTIIGGDIPLVFIVAVNWWLSGYINTGAYLLAPKLAAAAVAGSSKKVAGGIGALRTRAGSLMAFCFQSSCFLGLMGAWALQNVFLADWTHHVYSSSGVAAAAAAADDDDVNGAAADGVVAQTGVAAAAAAAVVMSNITALQQQQQQNTLGGGLAAAVAAAAHTAFSSSTS